MGYAQILAVSFQAELLNWWLMIISMMVPFLVEPLRWVAFRSFRHRRHQAMLMTLLGFLGPWMLLGIVAAWLMIWGWSTTSLVVAAMFGIAAAWTFHPIRKRALVACHRTIPLVPQGWKADRDCLRYGMSLGLACVGTCGLLMLACALSGHNLIAMIGTMALAGLERRSFRPPTRHVAAGTVLLAVWFLLPLTSALLG